MNCTSARLPNLSMKKSVAQTSATTGLWDAGPPAAGSAFGLPLQAPIALRHQNEEDGVGHP